MSFHEIMGLVLIIPQSIFFIVASVYLIVLAVGERQKQRIRKEWGATPIGERREKNDDERL